MINKRFKFPGVVSQIATAAPRVLYRKITRMTQLKTVLVVEDEPSVQTTLCATLSLMGFRPCHAGTIEAALQLLGTEHIDAVSLDVRLPDPSGLQRSGLSLLAFLRATAEYAQIPVMIFTGMPLSPEDEALVHRHDAQLFYKPQPYSRLIECLTRRLTASRSPANRDSAGKPMPRS
jgi:DNA-binding response OmpR family regulator